MASFYDSQSNDFATAVNGYLQGQNSIAQEQLEGMKSLAQGKEQMQTATTGIKATGLESAIQDKLQEHLNKFADELGVDFSVQGLGKPLLQGASKLLKAKATKMRESGSKKPVQTEDESVKGTEMEDMGARPAVPTEDNPAQIRETSFMDAEPRDVTGEQRPPPAERARAEEPEADEPSAPQVEAEPQAPEPEVQAPEPAPAKPELRGAEFEKDPRTQAAIDANEPIEVDAFSPTSAPVVRSQPKPPEPEEDEDVEPPEQPGLRGPGEVSAPEAPPTTIPDAPPSLSEGLSYTDESASTANPFSLFYRGDITDTAQAPGRILQTDAPVLRGPPRPAQEFPDVDFQFKAPIDPASLRPPQAFTKKSIDAQNAQESDVGGDALNPMRQELMARQRAKVAQDQTQSGERGGAEGADEFSAENQPASNFSNLQLEEPPYLRSSVPAEPPTAQPPAGSERPAGGEISDQIQAEANGNVNQISSQVNDMSSQIDDSINSARSAVEDNISDLTDQASKMASDLGEKATSMLGDITGSDLLGGLGSFLGLAGDILGPVMGGIGLFEAAKGIAEDQNPTDPYAKVRALISQGQQKMTGLEAQISSDQFAEKVGANMPSFGSLAAPVFSTQGMGGGSMHF